MVSMALFGRVAYGPKATNSDEHVRRLVRQMQEVVGKGVAESTLRHLLFRANYDVAAAVGRCPPFSPSPFSSVVCSLLN